MTLMLRSALPAVSAALLLLSPAASAQEVVRHGAPGFPIARAVEVPAGMTTVYVSGMVPSVVDEEAEPGTIAAYGDTETQTVSVLTSIQEALEEMGLSMGDVVKMQAYLVGDPELDGRMDFEGFMAGYEQFFGTDDQPNLPARSTMQVAGLVNPGWLVEIEVTAVRP